VSALCTASCRSWPTTMAQTLPTRKVPAAPSGWLSALMTAVTSPRTAVALQQTPSSWTSSAGISSGPRPLPPATKIPTGRAAALLLSPATARSVMPPSWYCSALVCCRTRPPICALRRVTSAGSATSMPNALSIRAAAGSALPVAWLRSAATTRARLRGRALASAPLLLNCPLCNCALETAR